MASGLSRSDLLRADADEWDLLIIGGGATGLGAAVEAASRGYRTLLVEARDFACATSSRSTKLVHGGVRYLKQGDLKLVLEALAERGRMLRNAPHLAHRQSFIVPAYSWIDVPFYGTGLTAYDLLARSERLGRSRILTRKQTLGALPGVNPNHLHGGILYYDGQFDDARYAIALLRTVIDLNGVAVNYASATALLKEGSLIRGVRLRDAETGSEFDVRAKVVINATGIFSDSIRHLDDPQTPPVLTVSQGTHFVLPRRFLSGDAALMIPKTSDNRVLFAIPWHDHVVVGTTDEPVPRPDYEPHSLASERQFLAANIERYLGTRPNPEDVLSMWTGQRPLVRQSDASSTAALSRDHTILISPSRLVTITGGKWTTYRKMGEDVIDRAAKLANLPARPSVTRDLKLHGWSAPPFSNTWDDVYGSDLPELNVFASRDAALNEPLHPRLPFRKAEVLWAATYTLARTVDDVLARRTRALFLDARAAIEAAPETARLLAFALDRTPEWQAEQIEAFRALAQNYIWNGD